MTSYSEFRLSIDREPSAGSYRVVATSPSGEALGWFKLPFSDIELENFVLKIGRTRRGERGYKSPEMELAKAFGGRLFSSLFDGDVKELFRSSLADARTENRGLRITLSLTGAAELSQIPWEYLYDDPNFMSISTWTPIVRYLELPTARRPLQLVLPLRIIGVFRHHPTRSRLILRPRRRSSVRRLPRSFSRAPWPSTGLRRRPC